MNEANFVKRMNWIVTGDFVLREILLPSDAVKVTSTGAGITAASAPTSVVTGTSFAGGNTALITFQIPSDYDEAGDNLVLRTLVNPGTTTSGHTSDMNLLNTQNIWRSGSAVLATAGTAVTVAAVDHVTVEVREIFMSLTVTTGGYKAGDVVVRTLDVNASSTSELILLASSLIYGSSVSFYNDTARFRNMDASTA